jgi:hypothetical protein
MLGVAALPLRVEVGGPQQLGSGAAGVAIQVERVTVGLLPWQDLALIQVKATVPLPGGDNLRLEAARVRVEGAGVGIGGSSFADSIDGLVAEGLSGNLGPIRLSDGSIEVRREGGRLKLRGWAAGADGGRLDVQADVSAKPPHTGQIRLYPSHLRFLAGPSAELLELSGAVIVKRLGQETDRIRLALDVIGPETSSEARMSGRSNGTPERLVARGEGTLARHAGQFTPESVVRFRGRIRDFETSPRKRALHGLFRGALSVRGSMGRLRTELELDLSDVRVRLGDRLDKPAGVPARVELKIELDEGQPLRAEGDVRLHPLRARLEAVQHSRGSSFRLDTNWCPLTDVLERVPALRKTGITGTGRVRVTARGEGRGSPTVSVELADLTVPLGQAEVRVPHARLRMDDRAIVLPPATLDLQGEQLEVSGELLRPRRNVGWKLGFRARGAHLRLDPLLAFLGPDERPSESAAVDLEAAATTLVRRLHAHSFSLRDLTIRPLLLEIDRVSGLGLPARAIRVEAGLEDRIARVKFDSQDGEAEPWAICLDLKHWIPQVSMSEAGGRECLGAGARPAGG